MTIGLLLSLKPMQTHTHIRTYIYTRVCYESVDGVGLETVQCVAQLQFSVSSPLLCQSVHYKRVWGRGWELRGGRGQPEANSGKCRPENARFTLASPATFARINKLL